MKVFLVGPPFSGHLHPLLGIGRRLQSEADVTVLSTPGGVAAAATAGLRGLPILADGEKSVWEIAEPGTNVKTNPLLLYRQLKANVALLAGLKMELDAIFQREQPDLVIADFTVPVAGIAARQQGIPWWSTLPSPCVFETPDGPPAYCGGLAPAVTWGERLVHAGLRRATRLFKRSMFLLFRRQLQQIGLPGLYRADGTEEVYSPDQVFALGIPEIELPRRYPPQFRFVGPVLYTPPQKGPSPDFVEGKPHVLVTIGTHLPHEKAGLAATIRAIASRHSDVVFHFTHGVEAGAITRQERNYHEYAFVSYADHVARYALVVHHAGAGILNHCLHHGTPSVVYPRDFDQFDNAVRLVATGVSLRVRRLDELETTILRALNDTDLKDRCRHMAVIHRRYEAVETIAQQVTSLPLRKP